MASFFSTALADGSVCRYPVKSLELPACSTYASINHGKVAVVLDYNDDKTVWRATLACRWSRIPGGKGKRGHCRMPDDVASAFSDMGSHWFEMRVDTSPANLLKHTLLAWRDRVRAEKSELEANCIIGNVARYMASIPNSRDPIFLVYKELAVRVLPTNSLNQDATLVAEAARLLRPF